MSVQYFWSWVTSAIIAKMGMEHANPDKTAGDNQKQAQTMGPTQQGAHVQALQEGSKRARVERLF